MYIDIVDELNSRYKSRVSYSYFTYRKVHVRKILIGGLKSYLFMLFQRHGRWDLN